MYFTEAIVEREEKGIAIPLGKSGLLDGLASY